MPAKELADVLKQLQDKSSAKRRSAARLLRKGGDPSAGPSLFEALQIELQDPRTWETQYQMIMAIGHCRYAEAFPLIQKLAHETFWATMRLVAIGDTYVRLRVESVADAEPVREITRINNENSLFDGALRACAMLRLRFSEHDSASILRFVALKDGGPPRRDGLRFWAACASAGWSGPAVETFLEQCCNSPREDVRAAAVDAKMKKYRNWRPL